MAYTPAEVLAAAKVLFPWATNIRPTCANGIEIMGWTSQKAYGYPNIDWQGLESYEEPKPWRPAEWPKDWGKVACFSNENTMPTLPKSILIGKHIDGEKQWVAQCESKNFQYAWVRDE